MTIVRKVMQYVGLRLPPPISTNAIWRAYVRKGHATNIKSKEYRCWITVAGQELEMQRPGRVPGPYGLRIAVPTKCRIDLDNCCKAAIDLLVLHGVVEGDGPKYLQKLEVWRGTEPEAMHIMIISTKEASDE